jgi:hypothetical protein
MSLNPKNAFDRKLYKHMCIRTAPMQDLRIYNNQSAKIKICGNAG